MQLCTLRSRVGGSVWTSKSWIKRTESGSGRTSRDSGCDTLFILLLCVFVALDLYSAFVVFNCNSSHPILAKTEINVSVVSVVVAKLHESWGASCKSMGSGLEHVYVDVELLFVPCNNISIFF